MKQKTFVDEALAADDSSDPDESIDDWVDRWHNDKSTQLPLHEYLGMSWEQYGRWLEKPSSLVPILNEIRENASCGAQRKDKS